MGKQVAARLKKENLLYSKWGCSSVGRAPALQAGGQEFESLRLHCERKFTVNNLNFFKKVLTKQNKFDILQQLSKTADK